MNSTPTLSPVKPNAPKWHLFTLEATIDEATYSVYPVRNIEDPEIERAFTFAKRNDDGMLSGTAVYTVARQADGRVTCECPDFVARHEDKGTLCKHGECCVRMGLLDAPSQIGTFAPPASKSETVSDSPAPEPMPEPPARQPELRRIAGMTIDLDAWRNGPRTPSEARPAFGEGPDRARAGTGPGAATRALMWAAGTHALRGMCRGPGRVLRRRPG